MDAPPGESTDRFYIGSTSDLQGRLAEHNGNWATATKNREPWRPVSSQATQQDYPSILDKWSGLMQLLPWPRAILQVSTTSLGGDALRAFANEEINSGGLCGAPGDERTEIETKLKLLRACARRFRLLS